MSQDREEESRKDDPTQRKRAQGNLDDSGVKVSEKSGQTVAGRVSQQHSSGWASVGI